MQLDSTYNSYLQTKVLSSAETKELIKQHRSGNKEALEKIVKGNQKLILSIARKFTGNGVEFEDMVQEGNMGLLTAIKKFDLTMENTFSTYASHWIAQAIRRSIEDKGSLIRVPAHLYQLKLKAMKTRAELSAELGRAATNDEIAAELNINPNEIYELVRATCDMKSIDEQNTNHQREEVGTLLDILEDETVTEEFEEVENRAFLKFVDQMLKPYDERKQYIFKARNGIGQPQKTLRVLAKELNITYERVRQLENVITGRIRNNNKIKKGLKEWAGC